MPRRAFPLLVLIGGSPLLGQSPESPRQLTGSATFGWMDTTARETFAEHRSNPFTTLKLDYQSYLLDPAFLTYRVQPRFSSGFQDGFTGMSEGSGVAFDTVFLPARPWPLRFHYSRFRRSLLTSGISDSYTRFISRNDDSTLGLEWEFQLPHGPLLNLAFDKVATATSPESILAQGFESRARTFTLNGRQIARGWDLGGGLTLQRLDSQYLAGSQQGALLFQNNSAIRNLNFLGQRAMGESWKIFISANRTGNRSAFGNGQFEQNFDSLSGKLEYRPQGRFQAWSTARLTDSGLESRPATVLGQPAVVLPPIHVSNRVLDSEARYQLHPDLSVFGRSEFAQVTTPEQELLLRRSGNFLNSGGGAQFLRNRRSSVLAASYYLYKTLTSFARDFSGSSLGHASEASAAIGDPSRLRLTGQVGFNRAHEDQRSLFFSNTGAERFRLGIGRRVWRRWTVEAEGGLNRSRFRRQELRSDFLGKDYGVSLTGSHYFVGYNHSTGSGDALQILAGVSASAPASVTPLLVVGSSNSSTSLNASWNLNHHMSLRGIWRDQTQRVGGLLLSRFDQREATFNWQFRAVRLETGYLVYRFNFGSPIERRMILFRVTRDFRVF